jgi:hypothetical protein
VKKSGFLKWKIAERNPSCETAKKYIEGLQKQCANETHSAAHKNIKRQYLDPIELNIVSPQQEKAKEPNEESHRIKAVAVLSSHTNSNLGTLSIIISGHTISSELLTKLLDDISCEELKLEVKDSLLRGDSINDYLSRLKLVKSGDTRVVISSNEKPDDVTSIYCMAREALDSETATPTSTVFKDQSTENIAQYDSSDIYCGKNVVLRIDKSVHSYDFPDTSKDLLLLFIVELVVMKDAAVSNANREITAEVEKKTALTLGRMGEMSHNFSKTMPLWNIDIFKYLGAQRLAVKVSDRFEIDQKFKLYRNNQSFLQDKVSIAKGIAQQKESSLLFWIALIVFSIEGFRFFSQIFSTVRLADPDAWGSLKALQIHQFISSAMSNEQVIDDIHLIFISATPPIVLIIIIWILIVSRNKMKRY